MQLAAIDVDGSHFRSRRATLQFLAVQAPERMRPLHGTRFRADIDRIGNNWFSRKFARPIHASVFHCGSHAANTAVVRGGGASAKDSPGRPMALGLGAKSTTAGLFTASPNTSWPAWCQLPTGRHRHDSITLCLP